MRRRRDFVALLLISSCGLVRAVNYDNEACSDDSGCLGGSCQNNVCRGTLEVTFQNLAGANTPISGTYLTDSNSDTGGIVIQPSETIALFGQVRTIYELASPVTLDKFSRLKLDVTSGEVPSTGKGLCVYAQASGETNFDSAEDKLCFILGSSGVSDLNNVISVAGDKEDFDGIPKNLALGKPASQSSLYSTGNAANAVDGDTNGSFNFQDSDKNSVTSTASEKQPWWQVDLKGTYFIKEIRIYKRLDGYSGRLLNFKLQIFDETNQIKFDEDFDDTNDENDENMLIFDVRAISGLDAIYGSKVSITLNGDVPRILSLAEFQVIGDADAFDVPIGDLFNTPKRDINRIAFIQDGGRFSESTFSMVTFVEMPTKRISTVEWEEGGKNSIDGNIQGTNTVNRSDDGSYISLRKSNENGVFNKLTFYHDSLVIEYEDPFTIQSVAISNDGIAICSTYRENVGTAVRMLEVSESGVVQLQTKIGPGMGRDVSIASTTDKAVISDPVKEEVYIYYLSTTFTLLQDSMITLRAPPSMAGKKFGEKVGLSTTGKALAVAAPGYESSDGKVVGAVLLYLYDSDTNEWEEMGSVIYGDDDRLGIGGGGVTASDIYKRVDANDSAGNRASYQFTVECYDKYAVPLVENESSFSPKCECGNERKSSNSKGGKLLRTRKDVCIPCVSLEGSGDCSREPLGPTFSPTPAPPTARPTVISDAPSHKPTVYIEPTPEPTGFPTSPANTLYDGAPCQYGDECILSVCEDNVCKSEAFDIDLQKSADIPIVRVNAVVVPSHDNGGGVLVTPSSKMTLHGNVMKMFRLSTMILISNDTRLRFQAENIDNAQGVYVCFFQSEVAFNLQDPRCFQPDFNQPQNDIIGFGQLAFGSRTTFVKYILFVQASGISAFSDVFVSIDEGRIFCGNECCDLNADKQGTACVCKDGYVSSKGGEKVLLELDQACISCQETSSCGLDGDSCDVNGYCWADNCSGSSCEAGSFKIGVPESADVVATLIGDFAENFNDTGGVIVSSLDSIVSVYGDTHKIFELSQPISFNKVTNLRFNFERIQNSEFDVGDGSDSEFLICLYEERDGDLTRLIYAYDESRCVIVTNDIMNIPFGGDYFLNTQASVKYIVLKQSVNGFDPPRAVSVKIGDVQVTRAQAPSQITDSGGCSDENAESFPIGGKCVCKFGYIASNGGKQLNEFDSCVPCIAPFGYDGETCYINRSCASGQCNSNKCLEGSLKIFDYNNAQIDATIDTDLTSGEGGVMTDATGKVELFGNSKTIYELSTQIPFNRFTQLMFSFTYSPEATGLSLCLYDSPHLTNCPLSCYDIGSSDTSPITIDAAKLISYRSSDLRYIGFVQETSGGNDVTSSFDGIQVIAGPTRDAYENGQCTDPNARDTYGPVKVIDGEEIKCACTDGYFSTNGGKLLKKQDACISCIDQLCDSPFTISNGICAGQLLVNALLGGLGAEPIPLYGTLLEEPFSPVLETGQGGGLEVQNDVSVCFFGGGSKTYHLSAPYTIDAFSTMYFYLYAREFTGFLAICLDGDMNPNNSTTTLCFNFGDHDDRWDRAKYPTYDFNLALGKSAAHKQGSPDYDASYAVDGNIVSEMIDDDKSYPVTQTEQQNFPWWEVNLQENFSINNIVIHFTKNRRVEILSDYKVEIFTSTGDLAYHHASPAVSDPSNSPFTADVVLPAEVNIIGSRVKITMMGEGRILSLREVEVFEKVYTSSPKRLVNLPIGRYRAGMEVNYVSFIRSTFDRGLVTNFDGIHFVYGFAQ